MLQLFQCTSTLPSYTFKPVAAAVSALIFQSGPPDCHLPACVPPVTGPCFSPEKATLPTRTAGWRSWETTNPLGTGTAVYIPPSWWDNSKTCVLQIWVSQHLPWDDVLGPHRGSCDHTPFFSRCPFLYHVPLLHWCYLHLPISDLPWKPCLRPAFGKIQMRTNTLVPAGGRGRVRTPASGTWCTKKQPPSAGPSPSCWAVQVPDWALISCRAGLVLGTPLFHRVSNPFLPEAPHTSVENRCCFAPLKAIATLTPFPH